MVQKDVQLETDNNKSIELKDDLELLSMMLTDSKGQNPLYLPGPYWAAKTKNTENEIKRSGIADFRGSKNLIGMSFSDVLTTDYRHALSHGIKRLAWWLTNIYPLNRIFEKQVRLAESHANKLLVILKPSLI